MCSLIDRAELQHQKYIAMKRTPEDATCSELASLGGFDMWLVSSEWELGAIVCMSYKVRTLQVSLLLLEIFHVSAISSSSV